MPHQCLKCGKVFEEGSSQLLKGCPDCGGNRFFFTKEALSEKERIKITEDVGQDINETIVELMGSQGQDLLDKSGNWVKIKPKDVKAAVEKHISESQSVVTDKKEDIDVITDDSYRQEKIEKIEKESKSTKPETIDIERPGSYKIDVKGLLEEEPIIIQKDGSYTIHLPSIFKMLDKEK
jgi:predicted  nucleic acid-binding Zn-ribbon protein